MSLQNWTKRKDGTLLICPLVGYEIGRHETAGLVRLIYAPDPQAFVTNSFADLQIAVNPNILRELGDALHRLADQIDALPKGTKQ